MALIACSECGKQVSNRARNCPQCGNPIATAGAGTDVQAIEQTAKRFKAMQLVGAVCILAGVVGCVSGSQGAMTLGMVLVPSGLIVTVAAKMAAWWHHA